LAYLLWAVTVVLGVLDAMVIRDTYKYALDTTSWHRYTLNAIDKVATVLLALALVIMLIFWEYYYRTGVQRGRLLERFCLMTAVESGLLFLSHVISFALQRSLGLVNGVSPYLLLEFCGVVVFAWLSYHLSHRQILKTPAPHE